MNAFAITTIVASLLAYNVNGDITISDDFSTVGGGTGWAPSTDWGSGHVADGVYSATGQNFRAFENVIQATDNTDFWVSFEISIDSNSWGGVSFYDGDTEVLMFGRDTAHSTWGIDGPFVTDTYSDTSWVAGETVRLLGHVEYNVNAATTPLTPDLVSLWVNPSNLSDIGTPDANVADNNLGPYSQVRFGTGSTGLTIDNFVVATDLSSIPEPSTVPALLAVSALIALWVRRKHA